MAQGGFQTFANLLPARFRHWSLLALAVWGVVVWTSRIRNVVVDDSLSAGSRVAWLLPAGVFVIGSLFVGLAWWRGRSGFAAPIAVFAVFTIVYWLLRAVLLIPGDSSTGFKVVHAILAAVSIALAAAVLVRLRRTGMIPTGAQR